MKKTINAEFNAGYSSGQHPHPDNDRKALEATTSRFTEPLVRAYWSGYLCAKTAKQGSPDTAAPGPPDPLTP